MKVSEEEARRLADGLAAAFAPEGWTVSVVQHPGLTEFVFDHPLSHKTGFGLPGRTQGRLEDLERFVRDSPEFTIVQRAPPGTRQAPLLRAMRMAVLNGVIDSRQLGLLAEILNEAQILTRAETEWLAASVPPELHPFSVEERVRLSTRDSG